VGLQGTWRRGHAAKRLCGSSACRRRAFGLRSCEKLGAKDLWSMRKARHTLWCTLQGYTGSAEGLAVARWLCTAATHQHRCSCREGGLWANLTSATEREGRAGAHRGLGSGRSDVQRRRRRGRLWGSMLRTRTGHCRGAPCLLIRRGSPCGTCGGKLGVRAA
jgi:hypothetical protein